MSESVSQSDSLPGGEWNESNPQKKNEKKGAERKKKNNLCQHLLVI